MKKLLPLVVLLLALTACRTSPYDSDGAGSDPVQEPDHSHAVATGENVVAHQSEGYCGNTITSVRCERIGKQEENWERSFWGGMSVGLTDFLRWLDYDDGICRCLPEYYVKTEFSASKYGINLSEGYVRYQGGQTQLTEEQLVYLRQTMDDIASGRVEGLCSVPLAK